MEREVFLCGGSVFIFNPLTPEIRKSHSYLQVTDQKAGWRRYPLGQNSKMGQ